MNKQYTKSSLRVQKYLLFILIFALIMLIISPVQVAYAAVINVTTTNDEINTNGQCSLREAIINANNDNQSGSTDCISGNGVDNIILGGGIYTLTINNTSENEDVGFEGDLDITDSLTISGVSTTQTIIQAGDSAANGIDRVFHVIPAGLNIIFQHVTIQHGNAGSGLGGGIYVQNASALTLNYVTLDDNTTSAYGGGIRMNAESTLNVVNSTISNNASGTDGAGSGGGVRCNGCTLNMDFSTVLNNSSGDGLGTSPSAGGAGMRITGTNNITINHSTITGNTADYYGGGLYYAGDGAATLTINNSTISGNISKGYGGGIVNAGTAGTISINASTIAGNIADSDNNGGESGGGIGVTAGGLTNISNSIVADNTVGSGSTDNCTSNTVTSLDYNLENDTDCGFTQINDQQNTNPMLAPLDDNGGPTLTHALQSNSLAAIDAIPSANCTESPINGIDQRGAARNYDGDGSGTGECDIGAYEFRNPDTTCTPFLQVDTDITIGNITFYFSDLGDLSCVTVKEMGPGVNHLLATEPGTGGESIQTNNWWQITGDGSGFNVAITLPYSGADSNSRVCKWPGDLGGYGWDCAYTSITPNVSVTRNNITSFSDWAVGDNVGPTAVTLSSFDGKSYPVPSGIIVGLLAMGIGLIFTLRYFKRKKS